MSRLDFVFGFLLFIIVLFALALSADEQITTTPTYGDETTNVGREEDDIRFIDGRDGKSYRAEMTTPKNNSPLKDLLYLKPDKNETIDDLGDDGNGNSKRTFESGESFLWPNAIVPYEFSKEKPFTNPGSISKIQNAIQTFHDTTCIRWKPFSQNLAQRLGHQDRVVFTNGNGCSSYAGRMGWGRQPLSLSENGCVYADTIQHEMGHALGMLHEQNRGDRDKNVILHYDNISGGKGNGQYAISNTDNYAPYNLHSAMQYAPSFFSSNGKPTMTTSDKDLQFLMVSGVLTFYDLMAINKAYRCADHCGQQSRCQNGGFVTKECGCRCPSGLSGKKCQSIDTKCGEIIDLDNGEKHILTSPNYPNTYTRGIECVWLIRAHKGYRIQLDVQDFDLKDKPKRGCYHWLEVRYNLIGQLGPSYCGNSLGDGTKTTTVSGDENLMMLKFNTKRYQQKKAGRGFKLSLKSVYAGCDSNPCQNSGICVVNADGSGYKCVCKKGFGGLECQQVAAGNVACDFESFPDSCFLKNVKEDKFDWFVKTGRTPSGNTGPDAAHFGKQYMFIEASNPRKKGDKARLLSTPNFTAIPRCLQFFYHMHGLGIGSLRVYIKSDGLSEKEVWSQNGRKGNQWNRARIQIPTTKSLVIIIEAERGNNWSGDIAIDSFNLSPGSCGDSINFLAPIRAPPTTSSTTSAIQTTTTTTATTTTTTTSLPPTTTTTTTKTTAPWKTTTTMDIPTPQTLFECNFDLSDCAIENWSSDIQWILGYAGDNFNGNAFYTISNSRKSDLNVAVFSLPSEITVNKDYCLVFDLRRTEKENNCPHVKIVTVNSLAVDKPIWAHSVCDVTSWTRYEVNISSASSSSSVAFLVQVMKDGYSNIQIDNIVMSQEKC